MPTTSHVFDCWVGASPMRSTPPWWTKRPLVFLLHTVQNIAIPSTLLIILPAGFPNRLNEHVDALKVRFLRDGTVLEGSFDLIVELVR